MKVKELYSDPSKWTQDWFAKDAEGNWANLLGNEAYCYCLEGAISRCYRGLEHEKIRDKVTTYLETHGPGFKSIAHWNDSSSRTFADIKKLVEELDI